MKLTVTLDRAEIVDAIALYIERKLSGRVGKVEFYCPEKTNCHDQPIGGSDLQSADVEYEYFGVEKQYQ